MFAYGIFYGRFDEERIKVKLDDSKVAELVAAHSKSDDEYEAFAESLYEDHTGIRKHVTLSGLVMHVTEHGNADGVFVSAEEEWLIAYGSDEEAVKLAYTDAQEEYGEDDDWEE